VIIYKNIKLAAIAIAGCSFVLPAVSIAAQKPASYALPVSIILNDTNIIMDTGATEFSEFEKAVQTTSPLHFPSHETKPRHPSDTAIRYFNKGVKNYEKGKWDKAEKAFESFLLTKDETKRKEAYYYLANINSKQGDERESLKYVRAFHGLEDSYVTSDCIALVSTLDSELLYLIESVSLGLASQEELESKIIELVSEQGSEFSQTCKLVSKSRAGHADFLSDE